MSTRALATVAVLLALLLATTAGVFLQRSGLLASYERPGFTFTNPLLDAPFGQRVVLRPMQQGVPALRYWLGPVIREPEPDDEFYPAPHIRVGVEERRPGQSSWVWQYNAFLALGQLGALTIKEWLEEIRPVRERTAGGGKRTLLRVSFGHETGATVAYFFDPKRPVPGIGWLRHELYGPEATPQVYFASPAGRTTTGGGD